ncbi:cell division protein FtsA [Candidatus Saccharibacteria bacterium]|nr:cell division protein FtsA [Candidatus Saccharibacteria bacterium]
MENTKHAVGLDIGTSSVRVIVASERAGDPEPAIIGFHESPSTGMRRGTMSSLTGPMNAIAQAIHETEKMIGYDLKHALVSINGHHITTVNTTGMIVLPAAGAITVADMDRLEDNATAGKMPQNRSVLSFVPHNYTLDGQSGIRDPLGMNGQRLEVHASLISAYAQVEQGIGEMLSRLQIVSNGIVPSVVAAGNAVLTDRQKDNGVAVIDFGASTTGIAIFHNGDLRWVSVIPLGSNDITNDLAVMLKTNTEVAEEIKKLHVGALRTGEAKPISMHKGRETFDFDRDEAEVATIARLDQIFDLVQGEIHKAGFDHRLPDGVVLVGGGVKLKGMAEYVTHKLEVATRLGIPTGFTSALKEVNRPEMAAAIGLMLYDARADEGPAPVPVAESGGVLQKLFSRFRSSK